MVYRSSTVGPTKRSAWSLTMICLSVGLTQFSKLIENGKWWNLFDVRTLELSKPCSGFTSSYEALKSIISVIYVAPGSFDLQRSACETRTTAIYLQVKTERLTDQTEDEESKSLIH